MHNKIMFVYVKMIITVYNYFEVSFYNNILLKFIQKIYYFLKCMGCFVVIYTIFGIIFVKCKILLIYFNHLSLLRSVSLIRVNQNNVVKTSKHFEKLMINKNFSN